VLYRERSDRLDFVGAMIRAVGLVKDFGSLRALSGLSFEVEPGEIYGLLGPNGAGKTTAMRLLSGLLRPTAGSATVAGYSIASEPALVRAQVGLLTELPGLYLRLTPLEYLDFFGRLHRLDATRTARVEEMLRLVGMWDQRRTVMRAFSKGMQQRVAIARTLLQDPPVLLLDEPTAALDPEAARGVRDYVRDLAARRRTILLCTHNLFEAEQLCARLSIVQGGRQVAQGAPAALRGNGSAASVLRVRAPAPTLVERIRTLDAVQAADLDGAGSITVRSAEPERVNPQIIRLAVAEGADVLSLTEHAVSLEETYLTLMSTAALPANGAEHTDNLARAAPPAKRTDSTSAMSRGQAWLVAQRELRETLRDPNLLLPLIVLPVLVGAMAGMTAFASFGGQSGAVGMAVTNAALDQLPAAAVERLSNLPAPSGDRTATLETLLKAFSIPLFWVIPVALTPAVAADSFVGERERGSLEPLLATPVGASQVLFGKLLAAVIPAIVGTWLGVLFFWLMTLVSRSPLYPRVLVADRDWLFSLVVTAPLVALFTAGVAALISTRVSGYRVAYQLNGLIVLPVVLVLIPATAFLFLISGLTLVYVALLFALLDLAVVLWSRRLFTRERLVSRR
jgi:ABC-2 type transport system ATP-binding protein